MPSRRTSTSSYERHCIVCPRSRFEATIIDLILEPSGGFAARSITGSHPLENGAMRRTRSSRSTCSTCSSGTAKPITVAKPSPGRSEGKAPPNGSGFAYDVRALDVDTGRLFPGAIVDRREPDEKMTGIPFTRVGSRDGSWAYTLYGKQNGGAFVHALHTTHREAFCIDLPLRVPDEQLGRVRMRVGKSALVLRLRGKTIAKIDTRTFEVRRR